MASSSNPAPMFINWTAVEIEKFITLMVDNMRNGQKTNTTFTKSGWSNIKAGLEAAFRRSFTKDQLHMSMNNDHHDDSSSDDDILMICELQRQIDHYRIREPLMDSRYTASIKVAEILNGHSNLCYEHFRMERHIFLNLRDKMVRNGWLTDNRYIRVDEQLAIFLDTVAHGKSSRQETIKPPSFDEIPDEIRHNKKYYSYFKDCIGAIDGTHISVAVPVPDQTRSAHDAWVFEVARSNPNLGFPHPPPGYASQLGYLTPFRGERYHLQDFEGDKGRATTVKELFNHRHSSLRNVIERSFDVLKNRFQILRLMKPYDIKDQAAIIVACYGLHNYIKEEQWQDELFEEYGNEQPVEDKLNPVHQTFEQTGLTVPQRVGTRIMNELRIIIANSMARRRKLAQIPVE
ncbi:uncharacterized protein LOC122665585 [Telopea speciosissima]|uniref:uncharacterized protein LOC122665585 n=1 Tax=Telopea speciosissima TaxID=54955 RepID=UPI001CC48535|nr:uncharacterized protein LOC122665585 [Telopea speciosissima]